MYLSCTGKKWISVDARRWSIFANLVTFVLMSVLLMVREDAHVEHFCSILLNLHIHTVPFGFGTTTIGEHHSVGSSILEITCNASILCNSASTFGSSGSATRRGT